MRRDLESGCELGGGTIVGKRRGMRRVSGTCSSDSEGIVGKRGGVRRVSGWLAGRTEAYSPDSEGTRVLAGGTRTTGRGEGEYRCDRNLIGGGNKKLFRGIEGGGERNRSG
jgi:hypothetical protein